MIRHKSAAAIATVQVLLVGALVAPLAQRGSDPPDWPRVEGRGVALLPNGWRIAPAGRSVAVGDFPMSLVLSQDGRHAIVSNNGWSRPTLTVVDIAQQSVRTRVPVEHAWLGLTWHPSGERLYSSGAARTLSRNSAGRRARSPRRNRSVIQSPAVQILSGLQDLAGTGFIDDIAIDRTGQRLYAVHVLGRAISLIDTAQRKVRTPSVCRPNRIPRFTR